MKEQQHIRIIYRIDGGILNCTEIEPILGVIGVKYPHRKSKDVYTPPMKANGKEIKTWHCCQEPCKQPDFEGGLEALMEHLTLHKGRLLKPWSKKQQLKSPLPAVRLPRNPWGNTPQSGIGEDRRFCIELYIDSVERTLRKQGIEIIEATN